MRIREICVSTSESGRVGFLNKGRLGTGVPTLVGYLVCVFLRTAACPSNFQLLAGDGFVEVEHHAGEGDEGGLLCGRLFFAGDFFRASGVPISFCCTS